MNADEAPGAYAAIQKAIALANRATPGERAVIEALAVRYVKDFDPAKRVELEDYPHNGWSLLGLKQALAGRGATSEEVDADLAASWARSEVWTRASRF
jgi:hypothetical protein